MLDLFRAEWIKVIGLRRPIAYLLFIFPFLTCLVLLGFVVAATNPSWQETGATLFGDWQTLAKTSWSIAGHLVSRLFLVTFTVVVFAGEYQWGTWKNVTPRRGRSLLLLNKLSVVSLLVLTTFVVESVVLVIGGRFIALVADIEFGPRLSLAQMGDFLPAYLSAAATTFLGFLVTSVFAILAAVYSRTILGGTLTGFVLIFADRLLLLLPPQMAGYLERPELVHLGRALPIYNIENVRAWMLTDAPVRFYDWTFIKFGLAPPADSMTFSVLVLAAWIGLGLTAACVLFERQDITS